MAQAKFISGDMNPRPYPVDSGTDFQVGDLVFSDKADGFAVKPAADFTWNSTLATTQSDFALRFAGVVLATYDGTTFSGAPSAYGLQTGEVMVAQGGVWEMDCASSSTFYPGTLVGPAKQAGNALESQKVVQTSTEVTSIGRVYQKVVSGDRVKFEIYPNLAAITTAADTGS